MLHLQRRRQSLGHVRQLHQVPWPRRQSLRPAPLTRESGPAFIVPSGPTLAKRRATSPVWRIDMHRHTCDDQRCWSTELGGQDETGVPCFPCRVPEVQRHRRYQRFRQQGELLPLPRHRKGLTATPHGVSGGVTARTDVRPVPRRSAELDKNSVERQRIWVGGDGVGGRRQRIRVDRTGNRHPMVEVSASATREVMGTGQPHAARSSDATPPVGGEPATQIERSRR